MYRALGVRQLGNTEWPLSLEGINELPKINIDLFNIFLKTYHMWKKCLRKVITHQFTNTQTYLSCLLFLFYVKLMTIVHRLEVDQIWGFTIHLEIGIASFLPNALPDDYFTEKRIDITKGIVDIVQELRQLTIQEWCQNCEGF